jgi:hypothetical protein
MPVFQIWAEEDRNLDGGEPFIGDAYKMPFVSIRLSISIFFSFGRNLKFHLWYLVPLHFNFNVSGVDTSLKMHLYRHSIASSILFFVSSASRIFQVMYSFCSVKSTWWYHSCLSPVTFNENATLGALLELKPSFGS